MPSKLNSHGRDHAAASCRWSTSFALGATPINHSSWHMLAMSFDGSTIRAFVNGSLDVRPPDRPHRTSNYTNCNERWQNPAPISTWTNRSPGTWGPGGAPLIKNKLVGRLHGRWPAGDAMPIRCEVFGDGAPVERADRRACSVRPRSRWRGAASNGQANGHGTAEVAQTGCSLYSFGSNTKSGLL